MMHKALKMTETLAHGYSSESTRQTLFNEYQHDRVQMVFKHFCYLDESRLSIGRVKQLNKSVHLPAVPTRVGNRLQFHDQ